MNSFEPTNIVALVPMKDHSERVPGKNLRNFGGRPLCFWILDALSASTAVSKIVINTDSTEIAEATQAHFDVVVHDRPATLCGDMVPMNSIINYDLTLMTEHDCFLQTHATNPFLSAATIEDAINRLYRVGAKNDSLFTVTRHQSRFFDASGKPINHNPEELLRTQDLPPLLEENSCLYLFTRQSFGQEQRRIGHEPLLYEMDPLEAIDIDTEADWRVAEAMITTRADP